jgi:glutamate dehydrogenase (NADP+)
MEEAKTLVRNGCICVSEGANMPSTPEAVDVFLNAKILYRAWLRQLMQEVLPHRAEMSQNTLRLSWTREEVDQRLHQILINIHETCRKYGTKDDGFINLC